MSDNLEREYRALVNSEAPDLWARIEAGLEDKKAADFPKTDSQTENVRGKKVNFKVWAGLAAACVCAALIVPAMARTILMRGDGISYSNSAPQEADSYENAKSAGPEEAIEEAAADNGAAADENTAGGSATVTNNANAATASNADAVKVDSDALEEELYIFRVTVEILDTDDSMNGGILYVAKVITSENPNIEADSEIEIFSSTAVLEESESYDLMLRDEHSDDSSGENRYWLVNDTAE